MQKSFISEARNSSSYIISCAWFADDMQKPLIVFVGQECLHNESISSEIRNGMKGSFQMYSQ